MSLYDTASTATLTTSPGRAVPRDHQNIAGALLYAWRESPGLCELQPWRGVVLGCEARGPLRLGSVGPRRNQLRHVAVESAPLVINL